MSCLTELLAILPTGAGLDYVVNLVTKWETVIHLDPLWKWVYFKDILQMKQEGHEDPG